MDQIIAKKYRVPDTTNFQEYKSFFDFAETILAVKTHTWYLIIYTVL